MKSIQRIAKLQKAGEENYTFSSDIIRLLDLLARIEIRRQARQRLLEKKAS